MYWSHQNEAEGLNNYCSNLKQTQTVKKFTNLACLFAKKKEIHLSNP